MVKVFLTIICAGATFFSCKARTSRGSKVKADIREVDEPVRVIFKKANTVFLVTCPQENGVTNDHVDDEKFLGQENCNENKSAVDSDGKPLVQKLDFESEYLPKLKSAIGFAAQEASNDEAIKQIKADIALQERKLLNKARNIVGGDVDVDVANKEVAKINIKLEGLRANLGPAGEAEGKVTLLNTLLSFLDINSTAAFNIEDKTARQLVAPFQDGARQYGDSPPSAQAGGQGRSSVACATLCQPDLDRCNRKASLAQGITAGSDNRAAYFRHCTQMRDICMAECMK